MNSRFEIQNNFYNLNITQADFLGIDLKDSEIQIKKTGLVKISIFKQQSIAKQRC